jgi:hypothetical protein
VTKAGQLSGLVGQHGAGWQRRAEMGALALISQ